MSSIRKSIGFIGIGMMGAPMTRRLLQAGYAVTIWNRTAAKGEALAREGAVVASSPAAVAAASDIVLACVTATADVEAIVFGADGIRDGAASGKVFVDHSSIAPDATREMAARLRAETGMGWVDAPVSGGVPAAEAGRLVIMAGGGEHDVEAARPVLMHLAQRVTHMGPVGAGQVTKLCNQVIVGSTIAVIAEALNLAARGGVDPARLPEALAGGYADSLILQNHARRMASGDLTPRGAPGTMIKDMDNALALGRATGTPLPMAHVTAELYRLLEAQGHREVDQIGLIRLYAEGPLRAKSG